MKRVAKGLKHLYVAIHALLIVLILAGSALFYIAFRPDGLELLNTYVLQPMGIEYKNAQGSLLGGLTLYQIHSESIDIKTLSMDYNLTKILKGTHTIDDIKIDGLRIHLDDFISKDDTSSLPLPTFALKNVTLTNLQLISAYPISLDIYGKNGSYDGKHLSFASLKATVQSTYASAAIEGTLKNTVLQGEALLYPNATALSPHLKEITTLPVRQKIIIDELSDTKARLRTRIDTLQALFDPAMSLHNSDIAMDYRYVNSYIDFTAQYLLTRDEEHINTDQKLRYDFGGVTTTTFTGNLISQRPLPSHILQGSVRNDKNGILGKLSLGDQSHATFASRDYDRFAWNIATQHKSLEFLPFLPKILQRSPFTLNAQGEYQTSKERLSGHFNALHNHVDINGTLSFEAQRLQMQGDALLNPNADTWSQWGQKLPKILHYSLTQNENTLHFDADGNHSALSLDIQGETMVGSGNYLGNYIDINGTTGETPTFLLTTLTPSLNATLSLLNPTVSDTNSYYDAEVRTKTLIVYDGVLHMKTHIDIPWYAAVIDSAKSYSGTENSTDLRYEDGFVTMDRYRVDVADHIITSDRPSYAHADANGTIIIQELWIYDSLKLSGTIDSSSLASNLSLSSQGFHYQGPEGEATVAADLHFDRDANATQKLSGNISILEGKIIYLPTHQLKVSDSDVIIVQDVRPPSQSPLAIEVRINTLNPIHYMTKDLDFYLTQDLTIWKDPLGDIQLLGMITIPKGTLTNSGRLFTIKPSHIYFDGAVPLNPYLDIVATHEVDYKTIQIFVTHTLDSPIFLFSSDPVMSQNDIMSYILFGSASDTALSPSGSNPSTTPKGNATNFVLGAGLKNLIGGATKIQLDTINILTTKEGGVGFEVGTRLNKDVRVLYKNDTVSSVLIQYTVNRWLRLDADIHELGQGINAIYIKDFRDFLPHNQLEKKYVTPRAP